MYKAILAVSMFLLMSTASATPSIEEWEVCNGDTGVCTIIELADLEPYGYSESIPWDEYLIQANQDRLRSAMEILSVMRFVNAFRNENPNLGELKVVHDLEFRTTTMYQAQ